MCDGKDGKEDIAMPQPQGGWLWHFRTASGHRLAWIDFVGSDRPDMLSELFGKDAQRMRAIVLDMIRRTTLPKPEQPEADPYAELKAAYAAGLSFQHLGRATGNWNDIDYKPVWSDPVERYRVKQEEPAKTDPYAALKEAYAAGSKTIQYLDRVAGEWHDLLLVPKWDAPPECYRVKPEPEAEPQAQPEEPAATNQKPQQGDNSRRKIPAEDYRSAEEELAQPDAGGWIEWIGGECQVSGDTIVQAILDSGVTFAKESGGLIWQHRNSLGDIFRYRVIREDKPPATCKTPANPAEACATDNDGPVTAASVLERAASHMAARAATYDSPGGERSMANTVAAFNAITGLNLTEAQGWLLLQLLKLVRLCSAPGYHQDSAEDNAAYAALLAEAKARESGGSAQ